ncbi:TRAP transporter small permease subunit [Chloroflexota bacterium]
MKSLFNIIDNVNEWTGKVVSYLTLVIMVIIVYEVAVRYGFDRPTQWVHETSGFLFGGMFILGGGYVLLHRGHLNMDIFYNRWSPRTRAIIDLATSVLFFLFCGLLLWGGIEMAWKSVEIREFTPSYWGPPIYPLKLAIPVGASLILLQGLVKFARDLILVITGKEADTISITEREER